MNESATMTCRELIDFIVDYVDGELDDSARLLFERHLDGCNSCRVYLATYRETMRITRVIAVDEIVDDVPEDLVRVILAKRS